MHPEAHAGFGRMLTRSGVDPLGNWRILDVGGQSVNGTVHDYFPNATITTLDLENADIIADARTWQPTERYDIVIATEVFEHIEHWDQVVATMSNALDDYGPCLLIATCASTNRQPHGATGAPDPAPDEWYKNVDPEDLRNMLQNIGFTIVDVEYLYPPGDAYCMATLGKTLDITVIIPTVKSRKAMLQEAVASASTQTLYPSGGIIVESDDHREGPAVVRNRALERVETEWVAFLDDDDWLLPNHLLELCLTQHETEADVVWPWFRVEGGTDPFPAHRGRQWNPQDPHQIPITVLARTSALRAVGGFRTVGEGPTDKYGNRAGEDFQLWLDLSDAGFKFAHTPEITWVWRHHGGNSSGLPSRIK